MEDKSLVIDPFNLLTDQQKILVTAFMEHNGDKTKAKSIAGYPMRQRDPFAAASVRRAINHLLRPRFDKAGITFDKHLEFVAAIAYGDPAEICEVVDVNCRHCWGFGHQYQYGQNEYTRLLKKEISDFKKENGIRDPKITEEQLEDEYGFAPLDCAGGFGWDQWREPNIACPECLGDGVQKIRLHAWASQHPLFAGVTYDKQGNMIVKLRNQDSALEHVSKLMGYLVDKTEISIVDHISELNRAKKRAEAAAAERAKPQLDEDED